MNTSWRKMLTVFTIVVFLILCCVLPVTLKWIDETGYQDMRKYVMQVLRPGMSERQVYEALSHAGSFHIFFQPRDICQTDKPIISERAHIYLHSNSWHWYPMGLYVCFDESGSLIYFRETFD